MTACQRWTERTPSWRHTSQGGFNPARYDVAEIAEAQARDFVLAHHYSQAWPSAMIRYGLFDGGDLVGAIVIGTPMGNNVLTLPFPNLVPNRESAELSRLVLLDAVPGNAESWFATRAFELAALPRVNSKGEDMPGLRGIVAFSDPVARVVNGRQVMPGHVGTIYQAKNAVYTGTASPRSLKMLPDGSVFSARAKSKITGGERGAAGAIAQLVSRGASPLLPGQDVNAWLRAALQQVGAKNVRQRGVHRYVFRIGDKTSRRGVVIGLPSKPYPKRDAGQLDLFGAVA